MSKFSLTPTLKQQYHSFLLDCFPVHEKRQMIVNIRKNWFFPLSSMGIFCLNARINLGYFLGIPIAFLAAIILISQIPSLADWRKENPLSLRVVSFLTAVGICWGEKVMFCRGWLLSPKTVAFKERIPMLMEMINILSILAAVVGLCFVYFCVLAFWKKFLSILSESQVFGNISPAEWIVYGVLLLTTLGWMVYSFAQTKAFYETELTEGIICGAIYTSDSPLLVQDNCYLSLTNPENDIRQPLFAVFAAPFIGIPYLLGRVTGGSTTVEAILMNSAQVVMLFAANIILAQLMRLTARRRICFVLLLTCTYPQMLFTLMMEQYIVAYFWMVFCMYLISEGQEARSFALCGAGGTLITSMILMPLTSKELPSKRFRSWLSDMIRLGLEFVAMLLFFCRFDVIFNLAKKISFFSDLSGHELTFMNKLNQYIAFIHDCILAPNAGIKVASPTHISWQLSEVTDINLIGIALLILTVISAIWNRNKKSSIFASVWVGLSAMVLLVLGWGTTENGLILYSLYFGWAFFVLLFQLAEKIEDKLNVKFIIPALSICCAVALVVINFPSIVEMVDFAVQYYPT